jgi:hypothetical protein
MGGRYDPDTLLAEASSLRAAAKAVSPDRRLEYLARADRWEALVRRSTETPVIAMVRPSLETQLRLDPDTAGSIQDV